MQTGLSGFLCSEGIPTLPLRCPYELKRCVRTKSSAKSKPNAISLFRRHILPFLSATRLAHHQLEGNQQIDSRPRRVFHTVEHELDGSFADLLAILVDRGEWHGKKLRVADIVESHQPHLLRDTHTQSNQRPHEPSRCKVVAPNDWVRFFPAHNILHKFGILSVSEETVSGIFRATFS